MSRNAIERQLPNSDSIRKLVNSIRAWERPKMRRTSQFEDQTNKICDGGGDDAGAAGAAGAAGDAGDAGERISLNFGMR